MFRFPLGARFFGGTPNPLWAPIVRKLMLGALLLSGVALLGMQAPLGATPSEERAGENSARPPNELALSEQTLGAGAPADGARAEPAQLGSTTAKPAPCVPAGPNAPGGTLVTSGIPLGLNSATESDFDRLPGVGPKKAQEIVQLRQRLGRFKKVADLLRVRGVGPKTLKKWQGLLVVDELPVAPAPGSVAAPAQPVLARSPEGPP